MLTIEPSKIIGPEHDPYMLRWHIFRVGVLPRIFLHKFLRSDYDRALHNHPWWFVSVLVRGQYMEHTVNSVIHRRAPSIAFRPISHRHRVKLVEEQPCWTLFFTGPERQRWGFFCPKGYVDSAGFEGCED